jgi:predicted DNA binding protein
LLRARFRLTLPAELWVTEVSQSFPDATFRLLAGVPKDDRAIELGEIRASDPQAAAAAVREHPTIDAFECLLADDQRALTQYEADNQRLYQFLRRSSLPPEFPIDVENGVMEFDVTATQEQFEAFGEFLDANDAQYELLSVVHTDDDTRLLTQRQRECLRVAHREGYFEVPRDCTLAELAERLDIDKSTASETIRRGTARIINQFLLDYDGSA